MEIMAFDEELSEVAQVLDEVAVHILLTPQNPNQVPLQQDPAQDPLPHFQFIIWKVSQTVMMNMNYISLGEKSRTFHHSS